MRKPKWDTEAGKKMWLDGKSDQQIAEALGTTKSAVQLYRCKKWVPTLKEAQGIPGPLPKVTAPAEKTRNDSEGAPEKEPEVAAPAEKSRDDNEVGNSPSSAPTGHLPQGEGFALQKYQLLGRINRAIGFIDGISFGIDTDKGDMLRNALEEIEEAVSALTGGYV